jgi:hypothetical protein
MGSTQGVRHPTFRVLDAMDAPHGGRILRLRLQSGEAPSIRELRDARLRAVSPDGRSTIVNVRGFAVFGGHPSDNRLARSGRIDIHVDQEVSGPTVGAHWEIRPA